MNDPGRTMAMSSAPSVDPNKTMLGVGPGFDPNKTILGNAPSMNMTVTIKPVQCPVCKTFNPQGLVYCGECGLIFELALDGDAFGAPSIQLPVLVEPTGKEHRLRPGVTVLGRQGDIVIEDSRCSRRHAQVEMSTDGGAVEDLGSTNGTQVNGARLAPGEKRALATGDKVSLGGFELTFALPGEAGKTLAAFAGKTSAMAAAPTLGKPLAYLVMPDREIPLREGEHTFGRRTENTIVISDPFVSGRHGVFSVGADGVFLTDVGSTNGTVVNDARLNPSLKTQVRPEDVIRLGSLELRLRMAAAE